MQHTLATGTEQCTINALCVSDEVAPTIYHGTIRERFPDVQLVLGCGDLPPSYLEFLVSALNVPCFYVPGNHDGEPEHTHDGRSIVAPEGATNIDGRVVQHDGLIIGGLGGSVWYNGGRHQYTQGMMAVRMVQLLPRIVWHRQHNGYGLDILVTHSPPAGIHDGTGAHAGFRALRWLVDRFPPRYLIHGHIHRNYRMNAQHETLLSQTHIINTAPYRLVPIKRVSGEKRVAAGKYHRYNGH